MYCPKSLAEYEEGFTECADCQVTLVSLLPPQPAKAPEGEAPHRSSDCRTHRAESGASLTGRSRIETLVTRTRFLQILSAQSTFGVFSRA